jgi:hypothetical protein
LYKKGFLNSHAVRIRVKLPTGRCQNVLMLKKIFALEFEKEQKKKKKRRDSEESIEEEPVQQNLANQFSYIGTGVESCIETGVELHI